MLLIRPMWRRKALAVARREFLTRVRTRWFVLSTLAAPVLLIGTLVLPVMSRGGSGPPRRVALLDGGDVELGIAVEQHLLGTGRWYAHRVDPGARNRAGRLIDSLTEAVRVGSVDGVLILSETSVDSGSIEYRGRNAASLGDMRDLRAALRQALLVERLRRAGVDPRLVADAAGGFALSAVQVGPRGERQASGEATFAVAYVLAFVLYVALFVYGQSVMRSVVEEKTTRMVEVLVSSMRPESLMAGKVLGVGSVGLFQLSIWLASGAVVYASRGRLAGALGSHEVASIAVPGLSLATLLVLFTYFVLGYFLYSALYAAVGAIVTTEHEAQHAQLPVTLLLVPGLLVFPALLDDPTSRLGVAMGLIPFSSPIIIPVRWIVGAVPPAEFIASLGLLLLATAALVVMAARVYRVGILMYGKRASWGEIVRWLRHS